jgi:murein DD-endopeptidase MepM/ murein hydrolase activator NlpD
LHRHVLSIRFDSPDKNRPVEWTVSGPSLYVIIAGAFLLLVFLGFLLTRVGDLASRASLAERLGKRNAELEENLLKIQSLEQELAALRAFDEEIREWAGLPPDSREPSIASGSHDEHVTSATAPGVAAPQQARNLLQPARLDADESGIDARAIAKKHPLIWPIEGWVSAEFREPRGSEGPHTGIDLVAARGAPVVAAAEGRVAVAGSDPEYGRVIVIDHGGGLVTLYGHNAELTVRSGDTVARGQRIASVGSTGRSTAPHLHFEVHHDGYALDPRHFLPSDDGALSHAADRAARD